MIFRLDNYNVLFDTSGMFGRNITENITSADLAEIKTIGVVDNDSYYKIEPKQVIIDSLSEEVILSYGLEIDLKISSVVEDAKIALLDSNLCSIVLAADTLKIDDAASDLSSAGVIIPANSKLIFFKPSTIKIIEDVKIGSREVNILSLKANAIANTKSGLVKEFNIVI